MRRFLWTPKTNASVGQAWFQAEYWHPWAKTSQMVYIIPNFLVLQFGKNFMKIQTKIAKLQMHENLHKNVNENMFSFTFLCKYS